MSKRPFVTCACPTFGRPHHLEEAIESFLRQEPGEYDAELLVLNDDPKQFLVCDAPGVRVINSPYEYDRMSVKFNAAVALAHGDLIAWWEDDDISLPWRLRVSVGRMGDNYLVYKPLDAWCWNHGVVTERHCRSLFFGGAMFSRERYLLYGGAKVGEWADQSAWAALSREKTGLCEPHESAESTFFVYRWAGIGHHDSGCALGDEVARHRVYVDRTRADARYKAGMIVLRPHWEQDYQRIVSDAMARGVK